MKSELKLKPNYISGLVQADGSFHISLEYNRKLTNHIRVTPRFVITQHENSRLLIDELKSYFKGGHIIYNKRSKTFDFRVNSLPMLINNIIPHFEKYPLKPWKALSFLYFKKVVEMVKNKDHLNKEGLIKIINIACQMNKGDTQKKVLKKIKMFENLIGNILDDGAPKLEDKVALSYPAPCPGLLDPDFISGLADGDGSFYISFSKGRKILPVFTIIQDKDSEKMLYDIKNYFGCGDVYIIKNKYFRFQVENLNSILTRIIPHFNKYPLNSYKRTHFEIFQDICEKKQNNNHKTELGFKEIVNLSYEMNMGGKRRKLTKKDYLSKYGYEIKV